MSGSGERLWDGRSKGSGWGNRAFMFLIRRFGPRPAYGLLVFVSLWYALTDRAAGNAVVEFRRRLGLRTGLVDRWRQFYGFGRSLIDRFAFLLGRTFRYECTGERIIVDAVAQNRGVILLSAHVGNWELAGNLLFDRISTPVNLVVLDNEQREVKQVFEHATRFRRVNIISVSADTLDLTLQLVRALRRGEVVCLHGDRLMGQRGRVVRFLGADARFPAGPFALASIAGSPIVPVFIVKSGPAGYTMTAHEPIRLESVSRDRRDEAIGRAIERFVGLLEDTVRAHPTEWHNFYPFWA